VTPRLAPIDVPADRLSIRHTHIVGLLFESLLHLHVPFPEAPLSTFLKCVWPLPLLPFNFSPPYTVCPVKMKPGAILVLAVIPSFVKMYFLCTLAPGPFFANVPFCYRTHVFLCREQPGTQDLVTRVFRLSGNIDAQVLSSARRSYVR